MWRCYRSVNEPATPCTDGMIESRAGEYLESRAICQGEQQPKMSLVEAIRPRQPKKEAASRVRRRQSLPSPARRRRWRRRQLLLFAGRNRGRTHRGASCAPKETSWFNLCVSVPVLSSVSCRAVDLIGTRRVTLCAERLKRATVRFVLNSNPPRSGGLVWASVGGGS